MLCLILQKKITKWINRWTFNCTIIPISAYIGENISFNEIYYQTILHRFYKFNFSNSFYFQSTVKNKLICNEQFSNTIFLKHKIFKKKLPKITFYVKRFSLIYQFLKILQIILLFKMNQLLVYWLAHWFLERQVLGLIPRYDIAFFH